MSATRVGMPVGLWVAVPLLVAAIGARQAGGAEAPLKLLAGEPRLVVVNGYSTSFHWWKILQRKLDRYFEGKRVVEVRPATRGGTPIAKWLNVTTGEPLGPWTRVLRPALKAKGERPAVVLGQQSLQWAFGQRGAGIRSKADVARIKQGAEALEKYVRLLLADGADAVFVAMHIYKKPMEPEIGNERLALAELLKRKIPKVHAGPDVWEPTREHYPKAFARDLLHPNSIGAEIMAQAWFETLLAHDGLDVPEWSRKELAEALEKEPEPQRRGRPRRRRR